MLFRPTWLAGWQDPSLATDATSTQEVDARFMNDAANPDVLPPGTHTAFKVLMILAVISIVFGGAYALTHRSGPSDQSSTVATTIGAQYCDSSGFQIISKLDDSKATIYNCDLDNKTICVTYEHGIATDETAEVKLLFANTLGSDQPDCIS